MLHILLIIFGEQVDISYKFVVKFHFMGSVIQEHAPLSFQKEEKRKRKTTPSLSHSIVAVKHFICFKRNEVFPSLSVPLFFAKQAIASLPLHFYVSFVLFFFLILFIILFVSIFILFYFIHQTQLHLHQGAQQMSIPGGFGVGYFWAPSLGPISQPPWCP